VAEQTEKEHIRMTSLIEEVEKNQIVAIKLETDEELAEYSGFNHLMDVCIVGQTLPRSKNFPKMC
jgi:hypothetical protein